MCHLFSSYLLSSVQGVPCWNVYLITNCLPLVIPWRYSHGDIMPLYSAVLMSTFNNIFKEMVQQVKTVATSAEDLDSVPGIYKVVRKLLYLHFQGIDCPSQGFSCSLHVCMHTYTQRDTHKHMPTTPTTTNNNINNSYYEKTISHEFEQWEGHLMKWSAEGRELCCKYSIHIFRHGILQKAT